MQPSVRNLKALGTKTKYDYDGANANLLERFQNPFYNQYTPDDTQGTINIRAPEFTSLCPKTGQPDFAAITVEYEPEWWCVESKSFKLYLGSYRQHRSFHETCVKMICDDLVLLLEPRWITVIGQFTPRGGIAFWPRATWQKPKGALGARYCNDKDRRESQLALIKRLDRAAKRK